MNTTPTPITKASTATPTTNDTQMAEKQPQNDFPPLPKRNNVSEELVVSDEAAKKYDLRETLQGSARARVFVFVFHREILHHQLHRSIASKHKEQRERTQEEGYEELENQIAYNLGLRTWANWVDSTVDPNKTSVFFTTISADWGKKDGVKCFNETKPIGKRKHWGSGSSKEMMRVVEKVVKRMKVAVTFINITQISEYRIDAHSSVYTESGGKLLSEEEKANPRNAYCIHWCLPGPEQERAQLEAARPIRLRAHDLRRDFFKVRFFNC
ncbi:hypothetical protein V8G54_010302 [Vigna mungo]|uniref:Trichome birefringence-like C-terminal domain-containing protein n=1 Tax=Vigna mungo TaxID=3915 RepID=A0AAQ3NXS9_VIGMU